MEGTGAPDPNATACGVTGQTVQGIRGLIGSLDDESLRGESRYCRFVI